MVVIAIGEALAGRGSDQQVYSGSISALRSALDPHRQFATAGKSVGAVVAQASAAH